MAEEVQAGTLEAASEAMRRHAWAEARRLFAEVDAAGGLDAEGLRQLGKAAEWCHDVAGAVDAFERSYAAFVREGDRRHAAKVSLMLRHLCGNIKRDRAAARGWLQRAERLLEGEAECVELGYLWRAQGRRRVLEGEAAEGERLLRQAIDLGRRLGDANLLALSMSWLGFSLVELGRLEEAYLYLDEASAAAVGGELGPWATGVVYCNAIGAYREAGEFGLGAEWTQSAARWCQRESIEGGFAGICRVHRAEFLRLRGAWSEAEQEARRASGELEGFTPGWAGDAYYEMGLLRLRLGDLEGADQAFRRAHELGKEPQPGVALLQAARGDAQGALRSLETSRPEGVLDEMRLLEARASLACTLGETAVVADAAARAEMIALEHHGAGVRVLARQIQGELQVARGDPAAWRTLREAVSMWNEIDAPYEAAQARLLLVRALRQRQDEASARRECEAALATFERLGAGPDAALAAGLLEAPPRLAVPAQRTLLFSDVVGSTQLLEAIGDAAWTELSAWLDAMLRQCFASHGGEEVDHAGDGFFVAFPDPGSALACAISIQRRLADQRREHGFAPRLRIGVHAVEVSRVQAGYRGRGVHEASRIATLAGADEILASRETVPDGFPVSSPRQVKVKGIARPLELVSVGWDS